MPQSAAGVPTELRRDDSERKPRRRKLPKHRRRVGERPDELRVLAVVVLDVGVEEPIVDLLTAAYLLKRNGRMRCRPSDSVR